MKLVATMMLLVFTSIAFANVGLSIDTVDQHSNVSSYVSPETKEIDNRNLAHGPIDAFMNHSKTNEVDDAKKLADI
jgi:hypothetical protein